MFWYVLNCGRWDWKRAGGQLALHRHRLQYNIYMTISIANLSLFWVLDFIFSECKKILKKSPTTRKILVGFDYGHFNSIISSSVIIAIRVSCYTRDELPTFPYLIPFLTSPILTSPFVSHQSLQKPFIKISVQRLPIYILQLRLYGVRNNCMKE